MEIKEQFVFQTDALAVTSFYAANSNYIVEYNESASKEYCVLYFSSHNIYNPNNEFEFDNQIVKKDKYEWYGTRINYAHKHIFLRDIMKQWYLTGINEEINNPEKLAELLKNETKGYKIITLGSSAGGFAAVMYGQQLKAKQIFSFNGQFEVLSLLKSSDSGTDPILFRNRNNMRLLPYYDCRNFIINPETINYFYSNKSQWDKEQKESVEEFNINKISFKTGHHGIPFLKSNLPALLNSKEEKLKRLKNKTFHPLFFSLKIVGVFVTVQSLFNTALLVAKRYIRAGKK